MAENATDLAPATELGQKIAHARRDAGLSGKELAVRLSVSLWQLEQLEQGRLDASPYLSGLFEHTSLTESELNQRSTPRARPEAGPEPPPASTRSGLGLGGGLILASIAALVLVRFFTEIIPLFPRAANLIDIPIVFALVAAAAVETRDQPPADRFTRLVPVLGFALFAMCTLGIFTNLSRVAFGPALVFVYGILSPLVVYLAVWRLWPVGAAGRASRLLVGLGLAQIVVVALIDIPRFVLTDNPDLITGTFGTNAYQLVFFLVVFIALLAGIYTNEPSRRVTRLAPALIGGSFLIVVLAQYRALLFSTALSIVLIAAVIATVRGRGVLISAAVALAFVAALIFGARNFPVLKLRDTASQDPVSIAAKRAGVARGLVQLYSDEPRFVITGTGPGTYSSRGWRTFALANAESPSNVTGQYTKAITGGTDYRTDVSDRYVRPALTPGLSTVSGSSAADQPYLEYVGVAAETGLLGAVILIALYAGAFAAALRRTLIAVRRTRPDDPVAGLLLAATVAFFLLIQMGFLENWLEVTRLTFVSWALLAISLKEFAARSELTLQ